MEKLKSIVSRGSEGESSKEDTSGATGKMTGAGSHFPKYDQPVGGAGSYHDQTTYVPGTDATTGPTGLGSTAAGTDGASGGVKATVDDVLAAKDTAGPEGAGGTHVGTTSATPPTETSHLGSVPMGSATTAATQAFSKPDESRDTTEVKTADTDQPSGVGMPSMAAVAAKAVTGPDSTTSPTPATLFSTTDPTERSAEYGESANTKVPGSNTTYTQGGSGSLVGNLLGAVGLGSIATAAGYAVASDKRDEAVADESTPPSQPRQPPSHHRKESIPTTAYPGGPGSPKAIAAPVGGTRPSISETDTNKGSAFGDHPSTGVTATTGGVGGSSGVTSGLLDESKALRENITGEPTGSPVAVGVTATTHSTPAAVSDDLKDESKALREGATAPTGTTTDATTTTGTNPIAKKDEDHTGRDAAIGAGVVAGAGAAGAAGAHEFSKRDAEQDERQAAKEKAAKEKELEAQKAQQEKELEKQHKEREKAAAKEEHAKQQEIEKAEKARQKEAEKEQKQKEKEAKEEEKRKEKEAKEEEKRKEKEAKEEEKRKEKEAKEAEKKQKEEEKKKEKEAKEEAKKKEKEEKKEKAAALAAAEKKQEKERRASVAMEEKQAEKEKKEREAAAVAAGTGAAGAAGAVAATGHDQDPATTSAVAQQNVANATTDTKDEPSTQKEKKPSIFKRIFKRRKNKDTGAEEEYSTDDDTAAGERRRSSVGGEGRRKSGSVPRQDKTKYEEASGGFQKPSYNPFKKDKRASMSDPPATSSKVVDDPTSSSTFPAAGTAATTAVAGEPKANEPWTSDDTTGGLSREGPDGAGTTATSGTTVPAGTATEGHPSISSTTAQHTTVPGTATATDESTVGDKALDEHAGTAPREHESVGERLKEAVHGLGAGEMTRTD